MLCMCVWGGGDTVSRTAELLQLTIMREKEMKMLEDI